MNITPNQETPLQEWLSYLEQLHNKTIDLGLDRIKTEANRLNLTKIAPFVITVGGTNGKGTTCRLLELLLLNAGLNVGVYSSPHLLDYRERVRINDQLLDEKLHCQSFAFIEHQRQNSLSYFEFSTLSAFYLFQKAQLDVVILEVGLGGRLDATNIIDNNLAVITSIDIDHTSFLGNTREAIAFEKAGIFKPQRPVVIGEKNIPSTMLAHAKALRCNLSCRSDWSVTEKKDSWSFKTNGFSLQQLPKPAIPLANAASALACLPFLPVKLTETHIHKALKTVSLTGRFQKLSEDLRQKLAKRLNKKESDLPQIILDVGHNPHAARYLASQLELLKKDLPRESNNFCTFAAIIGILQDKDSLGIFKPLIPHIKQWHCLTLTGDRGRSGEVLKQQLMSCNVENITVNETMKLALNNAVSTLTNQDLLLIFGSFHTVEAFLSYIETQN